MMYKPCKKLRISKSRTHYYLEILVSSKWLVLHSAEKYYGIGSNNNKTVKLSGFKKLSSALKKYDMWQSESCQYDTVGLSLVPNKRLKPIDTEYINKVCPEYSF